MIVITGIRDIHIESIQENGGNSLAKDLAHVYHFYLFGERGRSGNMKLPSLGNSRIPVSDVFPLCGFCVEHSLFPLKLRFDGFNQNRCCQSIVVRR